MRLRYRRSEDERRRMEIGKGFSRYLGSTMLTAVACLQWHAGARHLKPQVRHPSKPVLLAEQPAPDISCSRPYRQDSRRSFGCRAKYMLREPYGTFSTGTSCCGCEALPLARRPVSGAQYHYRNYRAVLLCTIIVYQIILF